MLVRQNAPVIGASVTPYLKPGSWQTSLAYRGLRSMEHFSGVQRQYERDTLGNNVVNRQQIFDLGLTYGLTPRCSASLGVPLVRASWSIPLPARPVPGPRGEQNAEGLGDVGLTGRCWIGSPSPERRGNVSIGLGVKAPTGEDDYRDVYPDLQGRRTRTKEVDMSIQPGDGGWGGLFELAAFRKIGRAAVFASGLYLANPRDTNVTPSIVSGLGLGSNPAFADRIVNSVPDQFAASAGAAFPLGPDGLSGSVALRIEGLPRYDLIGGSHGFRRPGYETFLEPRVTFSRNGHGVSLGVPVGIVRNRQNNPYSGLPGDATFPDYIVLLAYSRRFGA